ncbi:uncharacterized protein BDR25DRAFT_361280 [Lindgomyces ingoldianus]|uniref:Uncharacterized protein n=1 Tax=Lindgomyces ingoldianus TaxID=673940 RepID=A0ACB6QF23_9PLEO|nr:uncharacterized protein BDR25DRAFT_361280 [Lindgomyces ingoldianus]KAF2464736.1 hypothetical protein BDR25DRAFT_361280 [Lindgomyces ingoldianus]
MPGQRRRRSLMGRGSVFPGNEPRPPSHKINNQQHRNYVGFNRQAPPHPKHPDLKHPHLKHLHLKYPKHSTTVRNCTNSSCKPGSDVAEDIPMQDAGNCFLMLQVADSVALLTVPRNLCHPMVRGLHDMPLKTHHTFVFINHASNLQIQSFSKLSQ